MIPSPLEHGHGLDVIGLGKHVEEFQGFDTIVALDELGKIPCQRGRVAGDVDDPFRLHAAQQPALIHN